MRAAGQTEKGTKDSLFIHEFSAESTVALCAYVKSRYSKSTSIAHNWKSKLEWKKKLPDIAFFHVQKYYTGETMLNLDAE
jgi:hypothetical protein